MEVMVFIQVWSILFYGGHKYVIWIDTVFITLDVKKNQITIQYFMDFHHAFQHS